MKKVDVNKYIGTLTKVDSFDRFGEQQYDSGTKDKKGEVVLTTLPLAVWQIFDAGYDAVVADGKEYTSWDEYSTMKKGTRFDEFLV